ncbi:MAG: hypothetical protein KJ558_10360 [Gammaproteobacteria bacterium]|nr:hypothetical protein [Gammaproteobacteria bacterium]MBU1655210.1 hypothetical protein [Gammaproteobacteria bacterium]MBU1961112.1 hypothetical protein [Gammaproteobacteria bacterium]
MSMNLCLCGVVAATVMALPYAGTAAAGGEPKQSPLTALAWGLHCADDQDRAASVLDQLYAYPIRAHGLPSEYPKDKTGLIHAATVDSLLFSLVEATYRFPPLQAKVERVALRWNFCDIYQQGDFFDIRLDEGRAVNSPAAEPFPLQTQGFELWGVLPKDPEDRFVPRLLSDSPLGGSAFEMFFHSLYRQRCDPHPVTGKLDREDEWVSLLSLEPQRHRNKKSGVPYPYDWPAECAPSAAARLARVPNQAQEVLPSFVGASARPFSEPDPYPPAVSTDSSQQQKAPLTKAGRITGPTQKVRGDARLPIDRLKDFQLPPAGAKLTVLAMDAFPTVTAPPAIATATGTTAEAGGSASIAASTAATPPLIQKEKNKLGIAGSTYYKTKLAGGESHGMNLSWTPMQNIFVRMGFDHPSKLPDPKNPDKRWTYSWGVGYSDWHPGTLSVQLNNWGPLLSGDGLAMEKAVLNLNYKIDSKWLRDRKIAGSLGFDAPVSSRPSFNTSWQWSPIEPWFLRVSLQKSVEEGEWKWSYNFGRWDWHPFTLALTYDNWGPNKLGESNFVKNGAVTLSYSFAF